MTPSRNIVTDDDKLLDATRDCVLAVGWRRTTMTDVARRAGVSRMTVYRRWPDMAALTSDVVKRELRLSLPVALSSAESPDSTSIAAWIVSLVSEVEKNPLFVKMIDVDPEVLLTYLLQRQSESQESVVAVLTDVIRKAQRHGDVRRGRPEVLAQTVVLMCQGFLLSRRTMNETRYTERIAHREMRRALVSYLT